MRLDGGRRGRRWLPLGLAMLVCALLAVPAAARATTYTVDSTGDAEDAAVGDEICLTAGGKCTLRAAIEEWDASAGEYDQIEFDETVFDGSAAGTIALTAPLPPLSDRGLIEGVCQPTPNLNQPCAGIEGTGAGPVLAITAEEVEIAGLAVTGGTVGIEVEGTGSFARLLGNWIGLGLDGAADGNATGILVGAGARRVLIGSEGAEGANVIADSSTAGVALRGASRSRILGNRFGVALDGSTPLPNAENVVIASEPGFPAAENSVGTEVGSAAAASPACDGGCNLLAAASGPAIDLTGGGLEPALATTIRGNLIGTDASGEAALANESGIAVGSAPETVIGGGRSGEANRIVGGEIAIQAGPGPRDLVVRGNLIGLEASGSEPLAPPEFGIEVASEGLSSPAVEAILADNQVSVEGGFGIAQLGYGAAVTGNVVEGGQVGILTGGPAEEHGNVIEGNLVEGSAGAGIALENELNEVVGNTVVGAGGSGIAIHGDGPFGVSGNLIGGSTAVSENAISLSGGAAVLIENAQPSENEVGRNHGFGNGGGFISLLANHPATEPLGPNEGIQPPAFAAVTQSGLAGHAEPGARVRVFRKADPTPGELESFLGEAVADDEGAWQVAYGAALPAGTVVAATQTGVQGGTSELALATTPGSAGGGASGGGGGGAAAPDARAPRTKIGKHPASTTGGRNVRFVFGADEAGVHFQCKLDRHPFRRCRSPRVYRRLKPGKHVFKVRAADAAGNVDPSPATVRFRVVRDARR